MKSSTDIKLTQYSHGAGCGCKISPALLDQILHSNKSSSTYFPSLLVGNETKDDAAVMEIEGDNCIISTTDFFMPIVDDPFDFGRIASANAISDVYAMGGRPLMAIAILGWPIEKLPPAVAAKVIEGARAICQSAGIPLAGGHSIDCPEPVFGLAVTGLVKKKNIKRNNTAYAGCGLYLTKPLGIGILSTAQKKGIIEVPDQNVGRDWMIALNDIGTFLGSQDWVAAMTDVTGFGLLGHLSEMCEGSGVSGVIDFDKVPIIPEAIKYLNKKAIPGGTLRNWESYYHKVSSLTEDQKNLLADPQTSGGLLIAVDPSHDESFILLMKSKGYEIEKIGYITAQKEKLIYVN